MKKTKDNNYGFSVAATLFETAKSLCGKFAYDLIADEIANIENCAFEYMCGTKNDNIDDYIIKYYYGEITIDELLDAIAYPSEKGVDGDE